MTTFEEISKKCNLWERERDTNTEMFQFYLKLQISEWVTMSFDFPELILVPLLKYVYLLLICSK